MGAPRQASVARILAPRTPAVLEGDTFSRLPTVRRHVALGQGYSCNNISRTRLPAASCNFLPSL
eukprot:3810414-Alexandrium_andersonii.AAC.1